MPPAWGPGAASAGRPPVVTDAFDFLSALTRLEGNLRKKLLNIDIDVTNGIVTLAGEAPNAQVKADATTETWAVSGVVKVINNLQVKSPPTA